MSRFYRRVLSIVAAAALGATLAEGTAHAALTDSEKAQIGAYYAKGDVSTAARARALLARPDLTPPEQTAAFGDAARRVPFDERRLAFVRAMLFGPATQASRSELVPAIAAGLFARAAHVATASGDERARGEEMLRIHRFVAREIASAGTPPRVGHDPSAGIRDDALRATLDSARAHLALPVLDPAAIPPAFSVARTQAEVAVLELASGLHLPSEVATWIGARGGARSILEHTGLLVTGLPESAPAPKVAAITSMIDAAAAAVRDASVLWIGKGWPRGLAARRRVLVAQTSVSAAGRVDPAALWSDAVTGSSPDAALAEIAFVLGRAAAASLAASDRVFAFNAERALERARAGGEAAFLAKAVLDESLDRDATGGTGGAISPASFVGHAVRLLLLDAPRAISLALVRSLAGRHEPAEQLALALGVLAANDAGGVRDAVVLGRTEPSGAVVPARVERIQGTPARIERFAIDGHEHVVVRAPNGAVTGIQRDGKPPALSSLEHARVPTTSGETWTHPAGAGRTITIERLYGRPEVGFVDDGRIVVRSIGAEKGRDAVAIPASGARQEIELDVKCLGAAGAVVARASKGTIGYGGIALLIEPGSASPKASVYALDGAGAKVPLGAPLDLAPPGPTGHHVRVVLTRDRIEIAIGGKQLAASLPPFAAGDGGRLGFAPGDRGEMEIRNVKIAAR